MPKYQYNGGTGRYYPNTGLWTNPGDVHVLDAAPDASWTEVPDADTGGSLRPAAAPVAAPAAPATEATPQTADAASPDADAIKEAEALLEANPELAARLVNEAKNA